MSIAGILGESVVKDKQTENIKHTYTHGVDRPLPQKKMFDFYQKLFHEKNSATLLKTSQGKNLTKKNSKSSSKVTHNLKGNSNGRTIKNFSVNTNRFRKQLNENHIKMLKKSAKNLELRKFFTRAKLFRNQNRQKRAISTEDPQVVYTQFTQRLISQLKRISQFAITSRRDKKLSQDLEVSMAISKPSVDASSTVAPLVVSTLNKYDIINKNNNKETKIYQAEFKTFSEEPQDRALLERSHARDVNVARDLDSLQNTKVLKQHSRTARDLNTISRSTDILDGRRDSLNSDNSRDSRKLRDMDDVLPGNNDAVRDSRIFREISNEHIPRVPDISRDSRADMSLEPGVSRSILNADVSRDSSGFRASRVIYSSRQSVGHDKEDFRKSSFTQTKNDAISTAPFSTNNTVWSLVVPSKTIETSTHVQTSILEGHPLTHEKMNVSAMSGEKSNDILQLYKKATIFCGGKFFIKNDFDKNDHIISIDLQKRCLTATDFD